MGDQTKPIFSGQVPSGEQTPAPEPAGEVTAHVVGKILQAVGSYSELMDKLGDKQDSEKNEAFLEEMRRRLVAGLAQRG